MDQAGQLLLLLPIFALFALSLDLILGYAGIVSLGHAAFFGMGAKLVNSLGESFMKNYHEMGEKAPRNMGRLADSPVIQADVARRKASLGSARVWLAELLKDAWATADEVEPIATAQRALIRLGCSHAIHVALEVADYTYRAAGTSSIFIGTPFERRFRDMHTLSQQIQSREAHFETVGRILLNGDPDGSFLG